jgi:hypothetical protein
MRRNFGEKFFEGPTQYASLRLSMAFSITIAHASILTEQQKGRGKKMDSRGIEPRTTPMLREYYTTKPQAQLMWVDGPE